MNTQQNHADGFPVHHQQAEELHHVDGFHTTTHNIEVTSPLIDSGASVSMTNERALLTNYTRNCPVPSVTSANVQTSKVEGQGNLHISNTIVIPNVLYVPGITRTLIATKSLTDQGFSVVIAMNLTIKNQAGTTIITAKETNGLYSIPRHEIRCHVANTAISLQ